MTLEQLQARVLELEEQLQTANTQNKTLTAQVQTLTQEGESLRLHNQKLFLRLTDNKPQPNNEPEQEDKSIEELVKEYMK